MRPAPSASRISGRLAASLLPGAPAPASIVGQSSASARSGGTTAAILASASARRPRQARVGAALDPAGAERQRLDLLEAEHQGRQGEAGLEHIAETRLALDPRPLRLQGADVAVERAQRHAELLRQRQAGDRAAAETQVLHQFEQTFGARHRCLSYGALTHCSTENRHSWPRGSALPSTAA